MGIVLLLSVFHGHHREGRLIISLIEKKSGIQLVHLPVFYLTSMNWQIETKKTVSQLAIALHILWGTIY